MDSEDHFFVSQEGHKYVGPPEPAIDEAWEILLAGQCKNEEIKIKIFADSVLGLNLDFDKNKVDLANSTFQWPESGFYFSGLDVYHSLHCLVLTYFPQNFLENREANSFY